MKLEKPVSTIGRFDEIEKTWTHFGDLKIARQGHGVIFDGQSFLVVGGNDQTRH